MSTNITFYQELARIVCEDWDPIGVCPGIDAPLDEYNSYLPATEKLVTSGADATQVSALLCQFVRDRMGMTTDGSRELEVANCLVGKFNEIFRD